MLVSRSISFGCQHKTETEWHPREYGNRRGGWRSSSLPGRHYYISAYWHGGPISRSGSFATGFCTAASTFFLSHSHHLHHPSSSSSSRNATRRIGISYDHRITSRTTWCLSSLIPYSGAECSSAGGARLVFDRESGSVVLLR